MLNVINALNANATEVFYEIKAGMGKVVSVDTKNPSIRSNVGVLLRKNLVVKAEGGYTLTPELIKMFSVKKAVTKTKTRVSGPRPETRLNASMFRMVICESLNIRAYRDYSCNVFIIPQKNKHVHQFEISHYRIRIVAKSLEFASAAMKAGFSVRPSKGGKTFYVDMNDTSIDTMKLAVEVFSKMEEK